MQHGNSLRLFPVDVRVSEKGVVLAAGESCLLLVYLTTIYVSNRPDAVAVVCILYETQVLEETQLSKKCRFELLPNANAPLDSNCGIWIPCFSFFHHSVVPHKGQTGRSLGGLLEDYNVRTP